MKMKKVFRYLLLLLPLVVLTFVSSNVDRPRDDFRHMYTMGEYNPNKVEIDPRLEPLLEEFILDAEYYGIDSKDVYKLNSITIGNLDTVYIDGEQKHLHGICLTGWKFNKKIGNIILSEKLYYRDPVGFKMVFYHEIGHWLGKDHLPPITEKDEILLRMDLKNLNEFAGIMHDGYNIKNSNFIKENWVALRHNFFVREMDYKDQQIYMHRIMKKGVKETITELIRITEDPYSDSEPSEDLCNELYRLEDLQIRLDTLEPEDMDGMFRL